MHFCVETPRGERDDVQLGTLHLSLNTPVIAIDELPVGPARAGIAVCEAPGGNIRLQIAVRSLRTGEVVLYAPDEELDGSRDAVVAVDAALSFAEGMGFLFDEDEVAARGALGSGEAAALWWELVEEAPERRCEPEASGSRRPRVEEMAPVLELVREVPVRGAAWEAERVAVGNGEEVVLSDVGAPTEAATGVTTASGVALSKFRLELGTTDSGKGADAASRDEAVAIAAAAAPQDSRIRLLSRF
jgi:hypothetical protein